MKISDPKLELCSKLGHENHLALEPENSAESKHYEIWGVFCKYKLLIHVLHLVTFEQYKISWYNELNYNSTVLKCHVVMDHVLRKFSFAIALSNLLPCECWHNSDRK